jgi:hypothetical protein
MSFSQRDEEEVDSRDLSDLVWNKAIPSKVSMFAF